MKGAAPEGKLRLNDFNAFRSNAMNSFVQHHNDSVIGTLSGFDRVRLRGTARLLFNVGGMMSFLWQMRVMLKDFKSYALQVTGQLRQATVELVQKIGQEVLYLQSPSISKEDLARSIARERGVQVGLVCVLSAVEPCFTYELCPNRKSKELELRPKLGKCLHYYHYFIHPQLGFMHARMQSWFPFAVHLCFNGREWLARQMDAAGLGYVRRDNCFTWLEDPASAQALMDAQLHTDWRKLLDPLLLAANPAHAAIFGKVPVEYYWSVEQSEWATDVMFRDSAALNGLYPGLIAHGMQHLGSSEVMRFLGRKVPAEGPVPLNFSGEIVSDLARRPEGLRIKHRLNGNWIKMYNKQGSVLRVETVINQPRDMKIFRPKEGDETGQKDWRYLRKGVADMHRRGEVCQKANERYLESMAAVQQKRPLGQVSQELCRPVRWKGKQARALNPLGAEDAKLLEAVNRGEFLINGFRNRDLRVLLHGQPVGNSAKDAKLQRRQAAAVTRKLRLLRAHGLIHKVPRTHRYILSTKGRIAITALLAARAADTATLAA
jgi:hypothetical protein